MKDLVLEIDIHRLYGTGEWTRIEERYLDVSSSSKGHSVKVQNKTVYRYRTRAALLKALPVLFKIAVKKLQKS